MKAIVWTKYGAPDGLQLREVAKPIPRENEILVKVRAAAASTADTEFRRLKFPPYFVIPMRLYLGVFRPSRVTIIGTEFAGEVEAAGKGVTGYRAGDHVYGYTGLRMGTYAEYLCLAVAPPDIASTVAIKPDNLPFEQAAAVPFGGIEALHMLNQAGIHRGDRVLIVGAGGSIGTYAVQLAKYYGAEVTGVDSAGKLEMLRSIGADHVIDYAREDFTRSGQTYEVIFDTFAKSHFSRSIQSLSENGAYLNANGGLFGGIRKNLASRNSRKRIIPWSAGYAPANLLALKAMIEAGAIRPVIDRYYPLEKAAEAHRYVESGQKQGSVVITIAP
jgi:NADPH:quinone reductase-like Zn-dependent oxidoreductase